MAGETGWRKGEKERKQDRKEEEEEERQVSKSEWKTAGGKNQYKIYVGYGGKQ